MNQKKAEEIVTQLLTNAAGLRYGSVSVSAKLHEGRVVEVSYSKTEHTRELLTKTEQTREKEIPNNKNT